MVLVEELQRFPATMGDVDDEKRPADQRATFVVAAAQQCTRDANVNFGSRVIIGHTVDRVIQCANDNQIDLLIGILRRTRCEIG